jgi:hypothetical protein
MMKKFLFTHHTLTIGIHYSQTIIISSSNGCFPSLNLWSVFSPLFSHSQKLQGQIQNEFRISNPQIHDNGHQGFLKKSSDPRAAKTVLSTRIQKKMPSLRYFRSKYFPRPEWRDNESILYTISIVRST